MSVIGHSPLAGASGAAGGADPLYVDDVFSTFIYDGNGSSTQAINNGIDLSGEGGMVWVKCRSIAADHRLIDTERGANNILTPNSTSANFNNSTIFSSFNNNGFSVATDVATNGSGRSYVSWSFRKAPGFFDVVTYTGNATAGHTISHSLGSTPGMIWIKCTSHSGESWQVWHRSATGNLELNNTAALNTSSVRVNSVTSTSFALTGAFNTSNGNGKSYVAYIFAHDDQSFGTDSDEAIIKCGSYTGNGSSNGPVIDLGFEPQFVLTRCLLRSGGHGSGWYLFDSMRGIPTGYRDNTLQAQESNGEDGFSGSPGETANIDLTPTGFQLATSSNGTNENSATYIYMAIRRPHKPPTAATEVFALDTYGGILPNPPGFNAGFTVDAALTIETSPGSNTTLNSRLTQGRRLSVNITNAEDDNSVYTFDYQDGWNSSNAVTTDYISYMFRRAPGFFDVVTYTGTGSSGQVVNHNLGVIPEMIILKDRTGNSNWFTYHTGLSSGSHIDLNQSYAESGDGGAAFALTSTAITFDRTYVSNINTSSRNYIAYLFATLDGISKVGSYSGGSGSVDVDCGFTAGARFVLIKRINSHFSDWYVWDTLRGIVSGNDPYKRINLTAAQVTNTDYIDPLNAGFTVTSSAPAAINASGGTYLFLAMA